MVGICPKCLYSSFSSYDRYCKFDGKKLVQDYEKGYRELMERVIKKNKKGVDVGGKK
jgi:hypothetical protein